MPVSSPPERARQPATGGSQGRALAARDLAARLGFAELLGQPAHGLSGGQRQRVALARALLAEPDLLLLDEPFSALDRRSRIHQAHVLKGLQQESGIPMIFVSHAMEEVSLLCDGLVLLAEGRVEAQGTPEEIFARTDLSLASRDDVGSCSLRPCPTTTSTSRWRPCDSGSRP